LQPYARLAIFAMVDHHDPDFGLEVVGVQRADARDFKVAEGGGAANGCLGSLGNVLELEPGAKRQQVGTGQENGGNNRDDQNYPENHEMFTIDVPA
jgi:hypothetical protein